MTTPFLESLNSEKKSYNCKWPFKKEDFRRMLDTFKVKVKSCSNCLLEYLNRPHQ